MKIIILKLAGCLIAASMLFLLCSCTQTCSQQQLEGYWSSVDSKMTIIDNGVSNSAELSSFEMCKLDMEFLSTNKLKDYTYSSEGNLRIDEREYQWSDQACVLILKESLSNGGIKETTLEIISINSNALSIKITDDNPLFGDGLIMELDFERANGPDPSNGLACPKEFIIGKWRLNSGTQSDGQSQANMVDALTSMGTTGLVYEFVNETEYIMTQEKSDGSQNVFNLTYSLHRDSNNKLKINLEAPDGKIVAFDLISVSMQNFHFKGKMDGTDIELRFKKEN